MLDCTEASPNADLIASIYLNDPAGTRHPSHSMVFTHCPLRYVTFEDGGQADAPLLWLARTCIAIPREHIDAVMTYLLAAGAPAAPVEAA